MKHQKVILLVEDNADDADLTRRAFTRNNIPSHLVVARDGVEALDYLFATGLWADRKPGDNPVLVLLDLKLPRIGGLEVLRQLRTDPRTKHLPVVVLTSSVEERDVTRAYDLGCNSYIRKPVDFTHFTEAVRQLGTYWLGLNVPPAGGA